MGRPDLSSSLMASDKTGYAQLPYSGDPINKPHFFPKKVPRQVFGRHTLGYFTQQKYPFTLILQHKGTKIIKMIVSYSQFSHLLFMYRLWT